MAADIAELHHGEGARLDGPDPPAAARCSASAAPPSPSAACCCPAQPARRRGLRPDRRRRRSPRSPSRSSWPPSQPTWPPPRAARSPPRPSLQAATTFAGHHTEHGAAFGAAAGSSPPTKPNPKLLDIVSPQLQAAADENAVLEIAYGLENAAAATYLFALGALDVEGGAPADRVDPPGRVAARRRARQRPRQAAHRLDVPAVVPDHRRRRRPRPSTRSAEHRPTPQRPRRDTKGHHGLHPRRAPPRGGRASEIEHRQRCPSCGDASLPRPRRPNDADGRAAEHALLGMNRRSAAASSAASSILGGALLAACGSDKNDAADDDRGRAPRRPVPRRPAAASTTAGGHDDERHGRRPRDVAILRTASSIEELAVAAYQTAIDSGLVTTTAIADAAKLFQSQHKEHSGLFQSPDEEGRRRGRTPCPTRSILEAIQPTIDALKDEMGVVALALELENVAGADLPVERGHLHGPLPQRRHHEPSGASRPATPPPSPGVLRAGARCPAAFQVTDKAVKAGTGV